mmetsp:Transcript_28227/g.39721  ORF Transcript_28227/g.39721 Transcript_28227/m.39721 type:complete len:289 (+) Transcript_28227:116-982(+)
MRLTLALLGLVALCDSFTFPKNNNNAGRRSIATTSPWGRCCSSQKSSRLQMAATNTTTTDAETFSTPSKLVSTHFPKAPVIEFTLENHVPLGCSVEESLATEDYGGEHHVFVSKVAEGGHAENAGLEVGDVIVGVTGTFGILSDVSGLGLEHIRSLISAVIPSEPLGLAVARNTGVMEAHESAIVDLCILPDASAKEVDNCVSAIHNMAYVDDEEIEQMECNNDENTECMLDDVFAMWAEDLPEKPISEAEEQPEEESAPKPAPWSSRSSPSGTYVRDPKTGKMENIG